jgi:hypothetical protein
MIVMDADRRAVEAEYISSAAETLVACGVKSGHYLYVIESGKFRIQYHGRKTNAAAGALCWFAAGMDRTILTDGPATWIVIRIRNRSFAPGNPADQLAWRTLMRIRELSRSHPMVPLGERTLGEIKVLARRRYGG